MGVRAACRIGPDRTLLAKTCTVCGVFKQASEYHKRKRDGYWQNECKDCSHKAAKLSDKLANARLQDTATHKNDPWTVSEIQRLQELIDEGLTYREVAAKMGRSLGSITQAKHKLLRG